MEHTEQEHNRTEQVLVAAAIYALFYDNEPINLRSLNKMLNYRSPNYKKVSFSNSGHAFNLAQRLNDIFKCDHFTVVKLTQGETIEENDQYST